MVANDVLVNCVFHEYCSRDDETFVTEVDVLIRTSIFDIEQQDEVEGYILESFNVVEIPKTAKLLHEKSMKLKMWVFFMMLASSWKKVKS